MGATALLHIIRSPGSGCVGMSLNAFPVISVIKCSQHCLASTSMSQVVDSFVFYKIQFFLFIVFYS